MRTAFVVLVVIQIVLLVVFYPQISALFGYRSPAPAFDSSSDGVRILDPGGFEVPPSVEVTTNRIGNQQCREISNFAEKEGAQAVIAWLRARGVGGRMDTKVTISEQIFRVYVGEFDEEEEAAFIQEQVQRRANELQNALIYQSKDKWRVSFGEFSTEENAVAFKERLEDLVDGLQVYIDTRQKTSTSSSLRYLEEDAEKLDELSNDPAFVDQLSAYAVQLRNCK